MKENRWVVAIVLACLAHIPSAYAGLGGTVSSIRSDQQLMSANRTVLNGAQYTIHTMTLPRGTVVREYVSNAGTVFAVAWKGPAMPNLKQILGSYVSQASDGVANFSAIHGGTGPVVVSTSSFVLQSAGHMGGYVGRAYLPGALPQGLTVSAIN